MAPWWRQWSTAGGLGDADVTVQHVEGAGCYGHNAADDAAGDAALIAMAVPGVPIRVLWTRADELGWAPFGAAMVSDVGASLGPNGEISHWTYEPDSRFDVSVSPARMRPATSSSGMGD